jgi:hypothetical protein
MTIRNIKPPISTTLPSNETSLPKGLSSSPTSTPCLKDLKKEGLSFSPQLMACVLSALTLLKNRKTYESLSLQRVDKNQAPLKKIAEAFRIRNITITSRFFKASPTTLKVFLQSLSPLIKLYLSQYGPPSELEEEEEVDAASIYSLFMNAVCNKEKLCFLNSSGKKRDSYLLNISSNLKNSALSLQKHLDNYLERKGLTLISAPDFFVLKLKSSKRKFVNLEQLPSEISLKVTDQKSGKSSIQRYKIRSIHLGPEKISHKRKQLIFDSETSSWFKLFDSKSTPVKAPSQLFSSKSLAKKTDLLYFEKI